MKKMVMTLLSLCVVLSACGKTHTRSPNDVLLREQRQDSANGSFIQCGYTKINGEKPANPFEHYTAPGLLSIQGLCTVRSSDGRKQFFIVDFSHAFNAKPNEILTLSATFNGELTALIRAQDGAITSVAKGVLTARPRF